MRWALLLVLGLTGCHHVNPCSPHAASIMDSACFEFIVIVAETQCPDRALGDCPEAMVALAACERAIDEHAQGCTK